MTNLQGLSTVGERIADALERRDLSQTTAAKMLGVARPTLNRWINDPGAKPTEANLAAIAELTFESLAWLRYGTRDFPEGEGSSDLQRVLRHLAELLDLSKGLGLTSGERDALNGAVVAVLNAAARVQAAPAKGGIDGE